MQLSDSLTENNSPSGRIKKCVLALGATATRSRPQSLNKGKWESFTVVYFLSTQSLET